MEIRCWRWGHRESEIKNEELRNKSHIVYVLVIPHSQYTGTDSLMFSDLNHEVHEVFFEDFVLFVVKV